MVSHRGIIFRGRGRNGLKAYLLKRIIALVPVMLIVATVVFTIIQLTPGNPAQIMLGEDATQEQIKLLEKELGLDKPLPLQLGSWLANAFRGNLGNSLYYNQTVSETVAAHVRPTLQLTLMAFTLTLIMGIVMGIFAAFLHNTLFDNILMFFASLGVSLPISWLGLALMLTFSLQHRIFPVSGYVPFMQDPIQSLRHMILPAITLGASAAARLARMTRANMLEVLQSDYIRMGRAKGVAELSILFRHAFKNALIPSLTVIGLSLANMMGGAVVTEQIFGIPGIGRLLVFSVFNRDYPLIQGIVLHIAAIYVLINLTIDILYALIDPRISYN
jgi:peptide/nickel transport system permease protein